MEQAINEKITKRMDILEYIESKFQITLTLHNIKSAIDIIGRRKTKINDFANLLLRLGTFWIKSTKIQI